MQGSDVWTKLAAIGTLTASVVALAVATVPPLWRRYWRRPKLELLVGAVEPWTRVADTPDRSTQQAWLRAEVRNSGRVEARNVRAVVQEWYERRESTARWRRRDLDPSALHWVSMPWGRREHGHARVETRETSPIINLPSGLSDFVDLICYTWERGVHSLVLDDERPRGFGLNPSTTEGEFVLSIKVVADNAPSLTTHVHYAISRESLFTDVQVQDGPPADAEFAGILTTIQAIRAKGENQ
jgi:hypothetical protein